MERRPNKDEWSFSQTVEEMYQKDYTLLERFLNNYTTFCFDPDDDALEPYDNRERCKRINFHSIYNGSKLFNDLVLQLRRRSNEDIFCSKLNISFNVPNYYGWLKRGSAAYPRSIIKDLTKATFEPFTLQHLAAANVVPHLKRYEPEILIGVYNATKNRYLYIRHGEETRRKIHLFSNMVKHFIYKRLGKPSLVGSLYLPFIEINPKPFCVKCGLIRKIENGMDDFNCEFVNFHCLLCEFSTNAIVHTPIVEKLCHTKYHLEEKK